MVDAKTNIDTAANGKRQASEPEAADSKRPRSIQEPVACGLGAPENVVAFTSKAAEILGGYMRENMQTGNKEKVQVYAAPEDIEKAFQEVGMNLALADGAAPISEAQVLAACRVALQYSCRTGHELYFNQLCARPDPVSLVGDWLATTAHVNVYTYEAAPVFSLIELEVLKKMARVWLNVHSPSPVPGHDGLFVPGGSIANLYGMMMARHWKRPAMRDEGMCAGKRLVAFCSSECHYSYAKAAVVMGLGMKNLVKVPVDEKGAMRIDALREAIAKAKADGGEPFFVGATAGTTVIGAYDPFDEIADVCAEEKLWQHVDGAWGGFVLFSQALREKYTKGIERADSLTYDPHKFMGMAVQCAVFIARAPHVGLLKECNHQSAAYLFQPDKNYPDLDVGDRTIQCGRRPDAFKLWLAWKAKGDAGWTQQVERGEEIASWFEQKVADTGDARFALAVPRSASNVCFWVVPSALRPGGGKFDHKKADTVTLEKLGQVAVKIKDRMQRRGDALIGFQKVVGLPNCFRIVFSSPERVTTVELEKMLERMSAMAEE